MNPPEVAIGLSATEWSAVSGLATVSLAVLTLGTLVVIQRQLASARHVHLDGLIERGTAALNSARAELFELMTKKHRRVDYNWDDLRSIRRVVLGYEAYLPIVWRAGLIGREGHYGNIARDYIEDIGQIIDVLDTSLEQNNIRIKKYKQDGIKILGEGLEELGIDEGDRKRALELFEGENNVSEFHSFMKALKAKSLARAGGSATDIAQALANTASPSFDTTLQFLRDRGGDADNVTTAHAWLEEQRGLLKRVKRIPISLKEAVATKRRFFKRPEASHA